MRTAARAPSEIMSVSDASPSSTVSWSAVAVAAESPDPLQVDDALRARAHDRGGLLLPSEVGGLRAGRRRGLVLVQPGVLAAETQPLDAAAVLKAVQLSVRGDHWFAGQAALWLYGALGPPAVVDVAVRDTRQLVLGSPVRVRRLAPSLLRSTRTIDGRPVSGWRRRSSSPRRTRGPTSSPSSKTSCGAARPRIGVCC